MRRLAIGLGAVVATLGTASSALPCSPVPPGVGAVRELHVAASSADRAFVTWERRAEPRGGIEPRAAALGPGAGWTWADPVDAPDPVPAPAVTPPVPGVSAAVDLGEGSHAVAVWRVEEADAQPGVRRRAIHAADRGPDGAWSPAYVLAGPDTPNLLMPSMCTGDGYGGPVVAVDGAGNAVAAWVGRDPEPAGKVLKWAARPAGGAWSAPATLAPAGASLELNLDASGTALLTWVGGKELRATVRRAGGAFGPVEALGPAASEGLGLGGLAPSVTVDASGRALAVWGASANRIVAVTRRPGGAWSAPADLSRIAERPPALISQVRLSRQRLRSGATALSFRMRAAGEVLVTLRRKGRQGAARGAAVDAARGLNRVVLLRRPLPPGAYTVQVRARAEGWAPASRSKRVVVLPPE